MARMSVIPAKVKLTIEYMFEAGRTRTSRAKIAHDLMISKGTLDNYLSEKRELVEAYQNGYKEAVGEWEEGIRELTRTKFRELLEDKSVPVVLFAAKAMLGYKDDSTIIHQGTIEHVHSKYQTPEQIKAMADRVRLLAGDKEIMDAQIIEGEKKE